MHTFDLYHRFREISFPFAIKRFYALPKIVRFNGLSFKRVSGPLVDRDESEACLPLRCIHGAQPATNNRATKLLTPVVRACVRVRLLVCAAHTRILRFSLCSCLRIFRPLSSFADFPPFRAFMQHHGCIHAFIRSFVIVHSLLSGSWILLSLSTDGRSAGNPNPPTQIETTKIASATGWGEVK